LLLGVQIQHDYKWGCDNSISSYKNPLKVCMGLSQTSGRLFMVVITSFVVNTTLFIVMLYFNPVGVSFTSHKFWMETIFTVRVGQLYLKRIGNQSSHFGRAATKGHLIIRTTIYLLHSLFVL
jgi:hypothetical protein